MEASSTIIVCRRTFKKARKLYSSPETLFGKLSSRSALTNTLNIFSFGAQARDDATVVEKCIIAVVKIIDDRGVTVGGRPNSEK